MQEERYHYAIMAVFLVLGGLLGWLIAEMLVRKSFKVASCLKTYPILAVLLVVLVLFCATGGLGYSSYCPDASEVEVAILSVPGQVCNTDDPAEIEAIQSIHRQLAGDRTPDSNYGTVEVIYHLRGGRTVARSFPREALTEQVKEECRQLFRRQLRSGLEVLLAEPDLLINIDADFYSGADFYDSEEWYHFSLEDADSRELLRRGILMDADAGTLELVNTYYLGETTNAPGDPYFSLGVQSWRKRVPDEAKGPGAWDDPFDGAYYPITVTPEAKNTWVLLEQYGREWKDNPDS